MNRVLVLSPEPVRSRMAGMGIRALRIAEHLGRAGHDVVLASPEPGEVPLRGAGRVVVSETREALGQAEEFPVAVVSGHAGKELVASRFPGAVVADLYDPFLVENLSYAESLGPNVFVNDRKVLFDLLERADFVLAATEEQRLFWLGLLLGRGASLRRTSSGTAKRGGSATSSPSASTRPRRPAPGPSTRSSRERPTSFSAASTTGTTRISFSTPGPPSSPPFRTPVSFSRRRRTRPRRRRSGWKRRGRGRSARDGSGAPSSSSRGRRSTRGAGSTARAVSRPWRSARRSRPLSPSGPAFSISSGPAFPS